MQTHKSRIQGQDDGAWSTVYRQLFDMHEVLYAWHGKVRKLVSRARLRHSVAWICTADGLLVDAAMADVAVLGLLPLGSVCSSQPCVCARTCRQLLPVGRVIWKVLIACMLQHRLSLCSTTQDRSHYVVRELL